MAILSVIVLVVTLAVAWHIGFRAPVSKRMEFALYASAVLAVVALVLFALSFPYNH